jgi:proton-translocating NADH-quinone oxidoreductase chain M
MTDQIILLAAIFVPTLGAFFLPLLGRLSLRTRNVCAFFMALVSLLSSLALVPSVLAGHFTSVSVPISPGIKATFQADGLAVFMAIVSSLVSTIIVLYSTSYISHYAHQNEYYLMVVLFLGAMMGLVFSANLLVLYVFWEITAIASWRLIGFFREKEHVVRADKAFLVTMFGAVAMLIGFISLYVLTGSFDLGVIKDKLHGSAVPDLVVLLILLGILSKSATFPLHTWLPDAGVAPSPVTALLHAAVLVKIGVYVFARLFVVTLPLSEFWQAAVLATAGVSALVSAGAALIETDLKRIIAYSTVSQIAFIFLGFASGTEIGVAGALLYILMHGLAKGGLFLCAGIVEQNTHTKDIRQLGGLIRTMPMTAMAFLFCIFSVMGIPPFGGFFSKFMVMSGAFRYAWAGTVVEGGKLWVAFTFLAGAFLTILYLLRVFNRVFLGDPGSSQAREGSKIMVACVVTLAVLSLAAGFLFNVPSELASSAVRQMLGMVP